MTAYNGHEWEKLIQEDQLEFGESYFVFSKENSCVLGIMEFNGDELRNDDVTLVFDIDEFIDGEYWVMLFEWPEKPSVLLP